MSSPHLPPWSPEQPNPAPGLPPVIGHRGAAASAPENTLAGIRRAKEEGARWVEFDVMLSRDGEPVLIHDEDLERTTDGRGRVRDHSLAELRTLDAGGWFDPAFRGERVPTLDEALDLCIELDLGVNLEIKPARGLEIATAETVVAVLGGRALPDAGLLLSSFAHVCLEVAANELPAIPRGYLTGRIPANWADELQRYGCATLHASQRRLAGRQIGALVELGVPLLVYTVNEPARARELRAAGVTSLFTDRVATILDSLA